MNTIILETIAYLMIALVALEIFLTPKYFGEERQPYSYGPWIRQIIIGTMILSLALRVLGII